MQTYQELIKTHELREGDYFSWCFIEPKGFEPYWCKSQLAVFNGQDFKDLFWSMGQSSDSYTLPLDNVELRFIGNIKEYVEISEHERRYYDKEDILDISHSNHSRGWGGYLFIKKSANISRNAMEQHIIRQMDEAEYNLSSAQRKLESLKESLAKVKDLEYDVSKIYI